jgi:GNAT superfamily N-acetyltransferase
VAIEIRSLRAGDSSAVARLLEELGYPTDESTAAARIQYVSDSSRRGALIAIEADGALGLITSEDIYYFPDHTQICRITALVVSSAARRRGVARLLVDTVYDQARSRGCSRIEVTTSMSRNHAHAFYEAAGFVRTSYAYVQDAIPDRRDA